MIRQKNKKNIVIKIMQPNINVLPTFYALNTQLSHIAYTNKSYDHKV